jgi:cytochrome oxidase Cu insertion factor (SCO1/SenC/PrrC family)
VLIGAIVAAVGIMKFGAGLWVRKSGSTSSADAIGVNSGTPPVQRRPSLPTPQSNFVESSSIRAPRYEQAMAKLREAEATGKLPDPPALDASAQALRAFGQQWQEEWGPNFEVIIEDARPLLPVGSIAPDLSVTDLDGVRVRVDDFRGKSVLLNFGSLSCPTTCFKVSLFESLARKYAEAGVVSIFVDQREAHPDSQFGFGTVSQTFSLEDRTGNARRLSALFGLTQRIVIDDMNNATKKAYAAHDNSAYLIDRNGCVLLSQIFLESDEIERKLAAAVGSPAMEIK